jgi:large subunit ribosomal protein L35
MPKMKTKSGAAKRFRRTAKGFKHRQAFRNHILTKKTNKQKRQLRGLEDVAKADVKAVIRMLPGKTKAR